MTKNKLTEGLREGDLNGTILPIISIDEYESKLDKDAIVIGFYAIYQDPAKDLNRFIQKSSIDILDTEVSPSPTPKGYYIVFVEIERTKHFIKDFMTILSNLESLTSIKKWTFSTLKKKDIELNPTNLKKYVLDVRASQNVSGFLYDSYLNNYIINENILTIDNKKYNLISFGDTNNIKSKYKLNNISINENDSSKTMNLEFKLGENWKVDIFENNILISKSSKSILIREL